MGVLLARKQRTSGAWKESVPPPVSLVRGLAPGQEAGHSGRSGGGGWGPGSVWRPPGSWRPYKPTPQPCWMRARIPWGGDGSRCTRRRGNAKWAEQEWALRPEVVFIIYFWFIFRKLREFLCLKAVFLVLENNFLGSTKYFSRLGSLFPTCACPLQGKHYLLLTSNSRFQYLIDSVD